MNTIQLAGHLGANPEPRVTPTGKKVTTLSLATSVYQNGKDETIWWRVTVWGDEMKNIMDHLKKGSAVMIVAEMRSKPEIYTDKEGKPQISLNVTAISIRFPPFGRPDRQESAQGQQASNAHSYQGAQQQAQPYQGGHQQAQNSSNYATNQTVSGAAQYAEMAPDDDQVPF